MKSTAGKIVWLILITGLFAMTACASKAVSTMIQPTDYVPLQDDDPTVALSTNSEVIFPQQEAVDGEREVMEAEIFGTLDVVDGCIRLNASESSISYLLIWPPDFAQMTENNTIQILDGTSMVVASVGTRVRISGGEIKLTSFLSEPVQEQIPPHCSAPYWIVGDEVNIVDTSDESQ